LANSTATLFSLDVYKKLIDRAASERRTVIIGQIASFVSLVIAALLAPTVSEAGVFKFFQTRVTYLATPFISVLLMGIFWRRTNYAGALFGMIGGCAIQIALAYGLPAIWPKLNFLYIAFIAQLIIMIGIAIVSLFTAPPREEQWRPFRWSPALLRNLADEKSRPWYQSFWLWAGIYAAAWVGIYAWFW
jgi:SSS family solute:Na+ symporter